MLDIRGKEIGMIFQDPMSSLNPVATVEKQIAEVLIDAHRLSAASRPAPARIELLELVGMPDAGRRLDAYPHQLSGGMCQRVMIAMAIACSPLGADRRRADHGARRHRAGPGAGPAEAPAGRRRHGA